jgi:pyrroline-5-carboxylate reductase
MTTVAIPETLGFIGAGRMATALVRSFAAAGLVPPENVVASDVAEDARAAFQQETGAAATSDNRDVVAASDVIFLAVKPGAIDDVCRQIKAALKAEHLVVSIAAGVTLRQLASGLGDGRRIIRVMPNTPCLVGASASAYSRAAEATEHDARLMHQLLSAVGVCYELPESLLDAVTGLSGSGPAFVYILIEALSDGGVRMGLPRDVATSLAAQTVFGAAKMVLETGQHPGALKDMVASPGGTTIAGLHELERHGVRGALMDAVEAATRRSQEFSRQAGP